jgi:hypothetical protein
VSEPTLTPDRHYIGGTGSHNIRYITLLAYRKSEDKIFQPSHNVKKQGKLLKEQ